ncbi:hypothetical protein [Kribbella swartbergensis]
MHPSEAAGQREAAGFRDGLDTVLDGIQARIERSPRRRCRAEFLTAMPSGFPDGDAERSPDGDAERSPSRDAEQRPSRDAERSS